MDQSDIRELYTMLNEGHTSNDWKTIMDAIDFLTEFLESDPLDPSEMDEI